MFGLIRGKRMAEILHNDTLADMWVLHTSNMKNCWLVNVSSSWLHVLIMCENFIVQSLWFVEDHSSTMLFRCITFKPHAARHVTLVIWISRDSISRQARLTSWPFDLLSPFAVIGNVFWNAGFQGYCLPLYFSLFSDSNHLQALHLTSVKDTQAHLSISYISCWSLSMSVMSGWIKGTLDGVY